MKSSRITKIEGEFMGVKFSLKPTPLNIDEVDEKKRSMLMDWYKENEPELHEKLVDIKSFDDLTIEDLPKMNGWKKDVKFRSEYLKMVATLCMDFEKPIADDVWESGDLPLSTINEAWDFFSERRLIPSSGVTAR